MMFGACRFLLLMLAAAAGGTAVQAAAPTFRFASGDRVYTLLGRDPAEGGDSTIRTVLVPIALSFDSRTTAGKPFRMDASRDVPRVLRSPVFSPFLLPSGELTQYADGMLRATFPHAKGWHTRLGQPEVRPVDITIPVGSGYVLTSRSGGTALAIVDLEFLQKEIFRRIPREEGALVVAMSRNTAYYADGDATVCCSWGTHGVDAATGNTFIVGSYIDGAPGVVEDRDAQPLTQQLAELVNDPLHDPLFHGRNGAGPGNLVPAWMRPASMRPGDQGNCGGTTMATNYFLLEPTDTNPKNNLPASPGWVARGSGSEYHVENAALLPWYAGATNGLSNTYSFPDARALPDRAQPCPPRGGRSAPPGPAIAAAASSGVPNGHQLIGYWAGYGGPGSTMPMREISPQWDVILVAFATPDRNAPEGTMQFRTPGGLDAAQFKADIAWLKSQDKKVMISLGGGGQHFTLADAKRVPNFVSSVAAIVSAYGFDGIDIDFESPSLSIDPGDADFQHPTTPSIVNLIAALRQLHHRFGPGFLISLAPEGTQIPAGYPSYGGQFGSYLPILYAIRDILAFVDVQDYNTPPLEGLDGEIYQAGPADYHAAMTELLLRGFPVGGDRRRVFAPMPAGKIAVGFLTGDAVPSIVSQSMEWLITGKPPNGARYRMLRPGGYPGLIGAMFWTIDADRRGNYNFSNVIGPQLHRYPPVVK